MKTSDWYHCYSHSLKGVISDASFSHPAKFAYGLICRIYAHLLERGWLQEGDIVADPFAGVGIGGIVAAANGLRWIGKELEQKFVDLSEQNFELHREQWEKMGKPHPVILQGDSRNFSSIIREAVDSVITSPPWGQADQRGCPDSKWELMQAAARDGRGHHSTRLPPSMGIDHGQSEGQIGAMKEGKLDEVVAGIVTSPPWLESLSDGLKESDREKYTEYARAGCSYGQTYGQSEGQLGGMPEGNHDAVVGIITSSPYADLAKRERTKEPWALKHGKDEYGDRSPSAHIDGYSANPANMGNLPVGNHAEVVDSIITSPPFGSDNANLIGRTDESATSIKATTGMRGVELSPANMGNLPKGSHEAAVDAICTSPPYEASLRGAEIDADEAARRKTEHSITGQSWLTEGRKRAYATMMGGYSMAEDNIGNQQGDTYWEACKDVYSECLQALKSGGVMAVVVKAFVRNKKIVDLPSQTLELLEAIGFEPLERIRTWMISPVTQKSLMPDIVPPYRKEKKSFFRRLAERRGSPRIDFEEVLIVAKPTR